jgi:hypothetical protein
MITPHTSTNEIRDLVKKTKHIKNIGIIHLPPAFCSDIESDITKKLGNEGKNVYYLQSCSNGKGLDPTGKMASFKEIASTGKW